MRQVNVEVDFSAIEVSEYLSVINRGGFVGLVGIDRIVVERVNAIRRDLHGAIGAMRLTERATWLDGVGQRACQCS